MINLKSFETILADLRPYNATLVAVSKTKSAEDIAELIRNGQKLFGENYVQELCDKHELIPQAHWHFIGHLQTNKVKNIVSFCSLIEGVDSLKLLKTIDKEAAKANRIQNCLLQVHIAKENTKFGLSYQEATELLSNPETEQLKNISIKGLMGIASITDDKNEIKNEFHKLRNLFEEFKSHEFSILSMGMTSDYKIALEEGSNMVRIGSAIFGER